MLSNIILPTRQEILPWFFFRTKTTLMMWFKTSRQYSQRSRRTVQHSFLRSLQKSLSRPIRLWEEIPMHYHSQEAASAIKLGQDERFFCCLFPLSSFLAVCYTHIMLSNGTVSCSLATKEAVLIIRLLNGHRNVFKWWLSFRCLKNYLNTFF